MPSFYWDFILCLALNYWNFAQCRALQELCIMLDNLRNFALCWSLTRALNFACHSLTRYLLELCIMSVKLLEVCIMLGMKYWKFA